MERIQNFFGSCISRQDYKNRRSGPKDTSLAEHDFSLDTFKSQTSALSTDTSAGQRIKEKCLAGITGDVDKSPCTPSSSGKRLTAYSGSTFGAKTNSMKREAPPQETAEMKKPAISVSAPPGKRKTGSPTVNRRAVKALLSSPPPDKYKSAQKRIAEHIPKQFMLSLAPDFRKKYLNALMGINGAAITSSRAQKRQ